jgi:hypothetical protein
MQTATDGTKREGFAAPVHSPNEFHLGPNGELVNGLGTTQYPANVKPVSPEEAVAMAEREQKVADAENAIEAKKQQALGEIAQEEARLKAERDAFEREKAEFEKQQAAAAKKGS